MFGLQKSQVTDIGFLDSYCMFFKTKRPYVGKMFYTNENLKLSQFACFDNLNNIFNRINMFFYLNAFRLFLSFLY